MNPQSNSRKDLPDIGDEYHVQRYWRSSGEADLYIAQNVVVGGKHVIKMPRHVTNVQVYLDWMELQKTLVHPRIMVIKDAGIARSPAGRPWVAMEHFVWQTNLRDLLRERGLFDPRLAEEIVQAILEGLHYTHSFSPPILHDDLKPENVLVKVSGSRLDALKLIDFSMGTHVAGTPPYQSPEQIQRNGQPTSASDFFSLGAMLYEFLTGAPAFPGQSRSEMREAILHREPDYNHPHIDPHQATFIQSCLAKSPGNRFQTAQQANEALASQGPPPPPNNLFHPVAVLLLLAMLVVIGGIIILLAGGSSEGNDRDGSSPAYNGPVQKPFPASTSPPPAPRQSPRAPRPPAVTSVPQPFPSQSVVNPTSPSITPDNGSDRLREWEAKKEEEEQRREAENEEDREPPIE